MKNRFPLLSIHLSGTSIKDDAPLEQRRLFAMKHCEVNILETYRHCVGLPLYHEGLVISSMMRGKKIMHLEGRSGFEFLPGETVILPEHTSFRVDFPEAGMEKPVQCTTVAIERSQVDKTIAFLNEHYPRNVKGAEWKLDFNRYHFCNNKELAASLNRLINISMEDKRDKDVLADLALTSLLVEIMHTQRYPSTESDMDGNGRFTEVLQFIRMNLAEKISVDALCRKACMSKSVFFRCFRDEFGLSPLEYIIRQRIQLAKKLLEDPAVTITDACYQSGFNNLPYFARIFRQIEGINAGAYRKS